MGLERDLGVDSKHFENQHEEVLKERWALVSTLKISLMGSWEKGWCL